MIRNNINQENFSKRVSYVGSILSIIVFAGICLLGFEIHKNHQKAKDIKMTEQNELEKNFHYVLLDSEETRTSFREIEIKEI
jgi:hypothetical protein